MYRVSQFAFILFLSCLSLVQQKNQCLLRYSHEIELRSMKISPDESTSKTYPVGDQVRLISLKPGRLAGLSILLGDESGCTVLVGSMSASHAHTIVRTVRTTPRSAFGLPTLVS